MGRRTRVREYDSFLERNVLVAAKDDRSRAGKVRNEKSLKRLVNAATPGVIANKVKELDLIEYKPDGSLEVKNRKVQQEAAEIKREVLAARFYPISQQEKEYSEISQQQGISEVQAKNLVARDYAIRAKAVLTAARADDVKIDAYTVGILNGLEKGQYERTVYGKKDSSGERRFSKGRFFTELGFSQAEQRRKEGKGFVGTEAAKDEARRNFLEYTGGRAGGRKVDIQADIAGRFDNSTPAPARENRFASFRRSEPKETQAERDSRFNFDAEAARRKKIEDEIPF